MALALPIVVTRPSASVVVVVFACLLHRISLILASSSGRVDERTDGKGWGCLRLIGCQTPPLAVASGDESSLAIEGSRRLS